MLASEIDLRKAPFLLKDGDIIGIRDDTEPEAEKDDFQTEADAIAKEDFRVEQEKERNERAKAQKGGKKQQNEAGLKFNVDF